MCFSSLKTPTKIHRMISGHYFPITNCFLKKKYNLCVIVENRVYGRQIFSNCFRRILSTFFKACSYFNKLIPQFFTFKIHGVDY